MNPGPPPRKNNPVSFSEAWTGQFVPYSKQASVKMARRKAYNEPILLTKEQIQDFFKWCVEERGNDPRTCRDRVNNLTKPLNPEKHHSVKAYRLYYHYIGVEPPKYLKVPRGGVRLDIPSTTEVIEAIQKACEKREEPCLIYKLLLESGARLKEVLEMLRNYDAKKDRENEGFYTYELNYLRKTKRSFYIFHKTPITHRVNYSKDRISKQSRKLGIVKPRQIRKYVSTRLVALRIPESTIDFIQGRTPTSILAKHYLNLYALASIEYKKYINWLTNELYPQVSSQ